MAGLDAEYASQQTNKRHRFPSWREFASSKADAPPLVMLQTKHNLKDAAATASMPPSPTRVPERDAGFAGGPRLSHAKDPTEQLDDPAPADALLAEVLVRKRFMTSKRDGR